MEKPNGPKDYKIYSYEIDLYIKKKFIFVKKKKMLLFFNVENYSSPAFPQVH